MKLTLDIWKAPNDEDTALELIADEAERVSKMLREGYTSGVITGDDVEGWWKLEARDA